jgi:hypothetical protein
MTETSVDPAMIGTFTFSITAPQQAGTYREYFNMVADGVTWMKDLGMYYTIDVIPRQAAPGTVAQLSAGQQIGTGGYLLSSDKHSVLSIQGDGNLVLYSDFKARWSSSTPGASNIAYLAMQGDGNLVTYTSSGQAIWNSGTGGHPNAYARLQSDGNLVVYSSGGSPLWSSNTINHPDYLGRVATTLPTSVFYPGQALETTNRQRKFVLQGDGNLVLYNSNTPIWASGTNGKAVSSLVMQGDGNLVLYGTNGKALWNSKTARKGASNLAIQDDGNLVIYNARGQATWSTRSAGK